MIFTRDLVRGLSNGVIKRQSKGFGFVGTDLYHNRFRRRESLIAQSNQGTAIAQWLRCCATNRKVAGSIPAGVIGIFHRHKILPIAL